MSNSTIFIPNFCVCSHKCKIQNISDEIFLSVAGVMPQGWDLGVLGESKTLALGFAMAPHRLRILVYNVIISMISCVTSQVKKLCYSSKLCILKIKFKFFVSNEIVHFFPSRDDKNFGYPFLYYMYCSYSLYLQYLMFCLSLQCYICC